MIHNNRNKNNNRRFSKNNNSNFKKRRFGGGGGGYEDEQQISPQARRNFENKMQQHLMKAKEYLSSGERVEAENHFQHADHYYRMSVLGLDKIPQQQQQNQHEHGDNAEGGFETDAYENSSNAEPQGDIPEIPVELMGTFPPERQEQHQRRDNNNRDGRDNRNFDRNRGRDRDRSFRDNNNRDGRDGQGRRDNRNEGRNEPREQRPESAAPADENNLAALPFMQTPIKEA